MVLEKKSVSCSSKMWLCQIHPPKKHNNNRKKEKKSKQTKENKQTKSKQA